MRRGRAFQEILKSKWEEFLKHAQADDGGFYEHVTTGRPYEVMRPLKMPIVRVRDMRNQTKTNLDFRALMPLNEMKVLGLMTWTEKDEQAALEAERCKQLGTQEPGDGSVLHQ